MGRLLAILALAVSFPVLAAAQHRGIAAVPSAGYAAGGVVHVSPSISHAGVRVSSGTAVMQRGSGAAGRLRGTARRVQPGSRHISRNTDVLPFDQLGTDFEDAPGLGFDFPHLAAVGGNRRHRGERFGAGFGLGGFLFGAPPVILEEMQPAETQEPAEDEVAAENAARAERLRRAYAQRSIAPPPSSEQPAAPAVASTEEQPPEYVFVRRDGGLLFAVAYSWENGTLRYVTREGMRRTVARDAIDLPATEQFNEQRGLNFRSPA